MSDQYDEYDGYDGYDGYDDYEDYEDYEEDYRPDGMPGPMMPPQGQPSGQPGFPSGQPGFPPGQPGFPPGQPGFPPGQPGPLMPYTPGPHFFGQNAPNMRPPNFTPRRPQFSPGPIRQCRNRFAFIWLINGRRFWAWISDVQGRTIFGYRWTGRRWVYFQANVNQVFTFVCVR